MPVAYIGIGSNLGDSAARVDIALNRLAEIGIVRARSSLYRTQPWGLRDQPEFVNAVALVDTPLSARALLEALQCFEIDLGRAPGERWGARAIDLDILTYGDERVDEPDLQIPHRHLRERAFVLVPLAEIDPAYAPHREALPRSELDGVVPLRNGLEVTHLETDAPMDDESSLALAGRVRALAEILESSDLVRLRVARKGDEIELARTLGLSERPDIPADLSAIAGAPPMLFDSIAADVVGIFHLSRPIPRDGDLLDTERELAYIEALGIRNPVRSRGSGRIVSILCADGDPVEYGQPLFEIDRG